MLKATRFTAGRVRAVTIALALAALPAAALAGPAATNLPADALTRSGTIAPVANASFAPGADALPAEPFAGRLVIEAGPMRTSAPVTATIGGRQTALFPSVALDLFTAGELLAPVQRGQIVADRSGARSYWSLIPQVGKAWRERADGAWSRAALPVMLVNDTDNEAHQGLLTFLYLGRRVSEVRFQFVQQTAPYLTHLHFNAWGQTRAALADAPAGDVAAQRAALAAELADRLPARPLSELAATLPAGALDELGGPLHTNWIAAYGLLKDGTLYYRAMPTPYGDYPYPQEMRFGVRSVTKGVTAPLALLHLAQVYGPWVLTQKIGAYVPGLDPKWSTVRFIDAANMATGFGGLGTFKTNPNRNGDGYLEGNYDDWFTAPSAAQKLAVINANLKPYPWDPGMVMRYRDQDYFLLGLAVNGFVKAMRGPDADIWDIVSQEVLKPIGVHHAPLVRTLEPDGRRGQVWFNAGFYPTMDDLAKIALLYSRAGESEGVQLLHRKLTQELLTGRHGLDKNGDASVAHDEGEAQADDIALSNGGPTGGRYGLGLHFTPYRKAGTGPLVFVPALQGSGANEVIILPNGLITLRMAKAAELPAGAVLNRGEGPMTIRAAERVAPFP